MKEGIIIAGHPGYDLAPGTLNSVQTGQDKEIRGKIRRLDPCEGS